MGFWDIAGKVAKGAVGKAMEMNDSANTYAEKYSNLSKEELIRKFKSSSSTAERMGITKVIKNNGWSVND